MSTRRICFMSYGILFFLIDSIFLQFDFKKNISLCPFSQNPTKHTSEHQIVALPRSDVVQTHKKLPKAQICLLVHLFGHARSTKVSDTSQFQCSPPWQSSAISLLHRRLRSSGFTRGELKVKNTTFKKITSLFEGFQNCFKLFTMFRNV